jgi:hypothetical protein
MVLQVAVGDGRHVEIVATPDARWLVADTTEQENNGLADVWSRAGCIGTASDSFSVQQETACVNYLKNFVERKAYAQLGEHVGPNGITEHDESPDPNLLVFCDGTYAAGFRIRTQRVQN